MSQDGQGHGCESSQQLSVPAIPTGWDFSGNLAGIAPPRAIQSQPMLDLAESEQMPASQTQLIDSQDPECIGSQVVLTDSHDGALSAPAAPVDLQPVLNNPTGGAPPPPPAAPVLDSSAASDSLETPPKTQQKKTKELGPGEKHAVAKFAEARKMCPDAVTIDMVCSSPEGLMHWACLDIDWNARKPVGQAFYRNLKADASAKERQLYNDLDDPLKKEYRQCWNLKRDYDFTTESKIITMTYAKESIDRGLYRTEAQIAVELGLAGFPNPCPQRTAILDQARKYVLRCKVFGGRWLLENEWLEEGMFLWMEKMVRSSCKKSWSLVAENKSEVNIWEEKAKQCRARRAYAIAKKMNIDNVSLHDVEQSEGGVEHWASVVVHIDAALPGAPKAKAKAKAKSQEGSGTRSLASLEKNLKGLVAQEMLVKTGFDQLKANQTEKPENWSWAINLFSECETHAAKVAEVKGSGFLGKFVAAALCTEAVKRLKKESGDEYHNQLLRSHDALKAPLDDWAKTIGKIKAMAEAAGHGDVAPSAEPPKKRKKAGK